MIKMYTDGSFNSQMNIGGWAAIILKNGEEFEYSGNSNANEGFSHSGKNESTAQRMEIIAVLEGLLTLHEPSEVEVISDSKYVVETMSKGWLEKWVKENDTEKKHLDLWRVIYTLSKLHTLKFTWVKGHAGNHYNERCDKLAQMETQSQITLIDLINEKKEFIEDKKPIKNSTLEKNFENVIAPFSEKTFSETIEETHSINKSTNKIEETHSINKSTNKDETIKSSKKNKKKQTKKENYYAVAKGRDIGIFKSWAECSKSVNRYKGSIFKRFDTEEEALIFMNEHK